MSAAQGVRRIVEGTELNCVPSYSFSVQWDRCHFRAVMQICTGVTEPLHKAFHGEKGGNGEASAVQSTGNRS